MSFPIGFYTLEFLGTKTFSADIILNAVQSFVAHYFPKYQFAEYIIQRTNEFSFTGTLGYTYVNCNLHWDRLSGTVYTILCI